MKANELILLDAGIFIGALLRGDSRHQEARQIVEQARRGDVSACTPTSILSEVYGALTWVHAKPPHAPKEAAEAVRLLVSPPSAIEILPDGYETTVKMLELSEKYNLTARKVHDARHAATALVHGITLVYTYDYADWRIFASEGLTIAGPPSVLTEISRNKE